MPTYRLGSTVNAGVGSLVWTIVSLVVALFGCFIVYYLFVNNKKFKTDNKLLAWLKSFLNFDKMLIETILKITYIFMAIFITLSSFALIRLSFLSFLVSLVFGNIITRIIYELILITIMIWKNTAEIKNKLK